MKILSLRDEFIRLVRQNKLFRRWNYYDFFRFFGLASKQTTAACIEKSK